MYYLKNTLFLELTKNQKASLFSFMKSFVKKHSEMSVDDILALFIEDEEYYYNVNNPHFEWIIDELSKDKFIKELKILIGENKKQLAIKLAQQPYIEKQKAIAREQRKKANDFKLSKEKPTTKQLYYYDNLCKKYNLQKVSTENLSKLDLKNMIGKIIDEHSTNFEQIRID